jgi:RHS repeat-associated protein
VDPPSYASWYGSLVRGRRDASGLTYLRNRYYDPATGQFTQLDPIGLAGGLNSYGFAAGDPINFSDPFGLCPDPENPKCDEGTIVSVGASAAVAVVPGFNAAIALNTNVTTGKSTLTLKLGGSLGVGATVNKVEGTASRGTLAGLETTMEDDNVISLALSAPGGGVAQSFDTSRNWTRMGSPTVGYGAGLGLMMNNTSVVLATPAFDLAALRTGVRAGIRMVLGF